MALALVAADRRHPAAPGGEFAVPRPPFASRVLKEDVMSRVERVEGRDGPLIRKTYCPRPLFLWRTFLRPAKAKREHDNLRALAAAGVPVTEALHWQETRVWGCVPQCALWLTDAGAVRNLKESLAAAAESRRRRALLCEFGRLLHALHAAAFVSLTAYPRNVLVQTRATDSVQLLWCDQPYLVRRARVLGTAGALVDLFDALFTPGRTRSLSRSDRLRALVAYGGGRLPARALWRRLAKRRPAWQRFLKGCVKIGSHANVWSSQP